MVWLAVAAPRRMPDAHRRSANPSVDGGNLTGLMWTMIVLTAACAAPVAGVLAAGVLLDVPALVATGLALSVPVGIAYAWVFGRAAHRRLRATGPRLPARLRTGMDEPEVVVVADEAKPLPLGRRDRLRRLALGLCLGTVWIPVLSAVISAVGVDAPYGGNPWAFPLALPQPLRLPVIVATFTVAGLLYALAGVVGVRLWRDRRRA